MDIVVNRVSENNFKTKNVPTNKPDVVSVEEPENTPSIKGYF